MYLRTVKVPSSTGSVNEYVRIVEAYRENGKVKQRTIADLGRNDLLQALLPQLERLLKGLPKLEPTDAEHADEEVIEVRDTLTWGPFLVVRTLCQQLGLWQLWEEHLGQTKDLPAADRALVLIANRLICPSSEHGLARWLETDFICARLGRRVVPSWHRQGRVQVHHRQLEAWYRTLDRLLAAKEQIEGGLFYRLRDLFHLQPDLVLYDITSTYFEGQGPKDFARHGYSRDGKPQNVQVVVGLVMVAGWPIAHQVWAGNRLHVTTVEEVIEDLRTRFGLRRLILVGDRGRVSEENLAALSSQGHGYLVGVKRRRNPQLDSWLTALSEDAWQECPGGINAREKKTKPPRTRVQEVASGEVGQRVFVIDSDERRLYEQGKREQAMQRTLVKLRSVQRRAAAGQLDSPEAIGAAAERALQAHHGYRYYGWELRQGKFVFFEHPLHLPREKRLEGKYVIATSETDIDAQEAVALYKQLTEVERKFRCLKDVLAMRPIYHQSARRVKAHIFVAALALLLQCLLERRLRESDVELSAEDALQAVETIRRVTFVVDGKQRWGIRTGSPRARQVLKALHIKHLRPPTPPAGESEVM